jgi:DNA polymerase-1
MSTRETLYLLDGTALAYRAYFSFITRPLINSKGMNTGAIYGFTTALMKILDEERPDHIAVVFDTPEPTFRHKLYDKYKATRERMPEDMASQLGKLKDVVRAFQTPLLELPGYEADDVMGTLARRAEKEGVLTYLVTGDKDFMQLISPLIKIYRPGKAGTEPEVVDERGVKEKFGVRPDRVIDVLGLIGDKSDNVPGVPGIGEKTAIPLVLEYGTIENLYKNIDKIPQKGVREKLLANKDLALLSKRLVTIATDAPVKIDFHRLRATERDAKQLVSLFADLEFKTLLSKVGKPGPPPETHREEPPTPEHEPPTDHTSDAHQYETVLTVDGLKKLCASLRRSDLFAFDTETTGVDPMQAHLVGLSFAAGDQRAWYLPVRTRAFGHGANGGLFDGADDRLPAGHLTTAIAWEDALPLVKPVLEDPKLPKIAQNAKYDMLVLRMHGIEVRGLTFDTMVASYVLKAEGQHNLDALALGMLNYRMISYEDLTGSGRAQKTITEVPLEQVAEYSAEDADITLRLFHRLRPALQDQGLLELCEKMEFPLIDVLVRVEAAGVSLDTEHLASMSKELERQLQNLVTAIHRDAGQTFNINSTQQLGEILFTRLKLPTQKKTKTGYSTDVSVLEALREQHPIIEKLLEFRQLTKLKSTYVDALPSLVNPKTRRVHTSYNQTVAATGRLSSSDPNLQNIPIRTEIGRQIRKAFVPSGTNVLLSADYSQIELRIMAHMSADEGLVQAFLDGEDIHTTTAVKVFGVPAPEVTRDMRRKAKEVNFGIMYGIGPFGLKTRLGISQGEAQEIIVRYFERFPKVRQFINDTLRDARANGYVTTMFGRRRFFPDITSRNQVVRSNAERAAINMPIQGSAADMIKVAMIQIDHRLHEEGLRSLMILQVHDELVFEVPETEVPTVTTLVRDRMRHAVELRVPVDVEIGAGRNWLEAH